MNLIEVSKTKKGDLPWSTNTIYQFSSQNKYPKIIIRIEGKLFFDKDAFDDLAKEARDKQVGAT